MSAKRPHRPQPHTAFLTPSAPTTSWLQNRLQTPNQLTKPQAKRWITPPKQPPTATITTIESNPTNENRFIETSNPQPCILVGVQLTTLKTDSSRPAKRIFDLSSSLSELQKLAETAGLHVESTLTQTLPTPDPSTYIRSGKVGELKTLLTSAKVCTVVFDVELSPGQQRGLEEGLSTNTFEINVIDRTALILDIFAQHARSKEGQLQVELALYQYRLPRLTRMWTHLGRQSGAGGVGLRGPGETQLEVDKRLIQERMTKLREDLRLVRAHRTRLRTSRRMRAGLPVVALIGYTNAGKSTLLNAMAGSNVLAADTLFATLDPTTRLARLEGVKTSPEILLTDTVGFVQNLPTELVAAFRATLEEVEQADLLVHVVDGGLEDEVLCWQMEAVRRVVEEIGAGGKGCVVVVNKLDTVCAERAAVVRELAEVQGQGEVVGVSARSGEGVAEVGVVVEEALRNGLIEIDVVVPYCRGEVISMIYRQGCVVAEEFLDEGTAICCKVPREVWEKLREIAVVDGAAAGEDETAWLDLAKGRHSTHDDGVVTTG